MTTIEFETEDCCKCGIIFQVTEEFYENRVSDGKPFFCPNGHEICYTDTVEEEIDKLKEQITTLQVEKRQLKCKLLGKVGMRDKIKMWWRGGLA